MPIFRVKKLYPVTFYILQDLSIHRVTVSPVNINISSKYVADNTIHSKFIAQISGYPQP